MALSASPSPRWIAPKNSAMGARTNLDAVTSFSNWIDAAACPRPAAQQAPDRLRPTNQQAVRSERLNRVLRARRIETAPRRQEARHCQLIGAHYECCCAA